MSIEYLFDDTSVLVMDNTGGLVWWGDSDQEDIYEDQYRGMSLIAHNAITGVSASSESAQYPAENVLDQYPQNQWRAADSSVLSATLTVSMNGAVGRITLHNVLADSAMVAISDPNSVYFESGTAWETGTAWANIDIDSSVALDQNSFDEYGAVKIAFEPFNGVAEARITLAKNRWNSGVLGVGTVCAGEVIALGHNPDYGLSEVPVDDYSTDRKLSNGAPYYKKRNIPRQFSGRVLVDYTVFARLMSEVWRKYGKEPKSYQIMDVTGRESLIYGRLNIMPAGSHDFRTRTAINMTIQEVM